MPGLCIRVSVSGTRIWSVTARVGGRQKRIKLGTYPALSLAEARQKTRNVLCNVETVVEPKHVPTLGEVIPQFIELYARPRNRDWKGTERILVKFEPISPSLITEITRGDECLQIGW